MKCEIKIPESGKIDVHGIERKYEVRLNKLKTDKNILSRNRDLILKFLWDAQLGKTIKQGEKKKIGKARCLKYISFLTTISIWLNKDFDKVKQEDMEKLILKLENDKYRCKNGEKYKEGTKVDFKKIIKKFYKWLLGNNEHYPDIVSWFDTSFEERDIPALSREEVEKMIECTPKIMNKALIMVLFDSGQRIEELLNNRLKHITKKEDYYMVRVEYSKTKPRTISLPLCTKYLDDWLAIHPYKDESEAQLFPVTYGQAAMMLRRLGRRVLGKSVYPHLMRHSSATYYANIEKNYFRFCKRYGWSFGSRMAERYIDRAGVNEEEIVKAVKVDEISKFKEDNQGLKEDLIRLKGNYAEVETKINDFMKVMASDPRFRKLLAEKGLKDQIINL